MKTVYTVLCLSLLSVCRASPLTCDQLLTFEGSDVDVSGRWYLHAMSTDSCVLSNLINKFLKPSIATDIVYQETLKRYEATAKVKSLSFCTNETESFVLDKNSLTMQSKTYNFLPSSCSDCIAMKIDSYTKAIFLYSRKTTIDSSDLKEFATLAACLHLPDPQRFETDYDFVNCKDIDEGEFTDEESKTWLERLCNLGYELFGCLGRYISSFTK